MSRRPHLVSVQTSAERGGGEYANVDLLDALAERGWRVKLLTNQPELAAGTSVPAGRIDLGPKLSRRSVVNVMFEFPRSLVRLRRALDEEASAAPIDVLLVHYKKEQLLASLLPRGLVPVVVWAEWGPVPLPLRSGVPRRLYLGAARRASRIIAESGGTERSLVEVGVPAEKVVVVPNIFDPGAIAFDPQARLRLRREWGASEQTFVIGCVSRFHSKKRTDVVVDALEHLEGDVLLVLAGEGAEEASLRRRAERFDGRVRFVPTPRGWVHQLLSACDIQVFAPSPTEGAARSVVFGQLVERAVIATAAEGVIDLIRPGRGAIAAPGHDAHALAASLEQYRRDPDRRAREGAAGRSHALRLHDKGRVVERLERALTEAG